MTFDRSINDHEDARLTVPPLNDRQMRVSAEAAYVRREEENIALRARLAEAEALLRSLEELFAAIREQQGRPRNLNAVAVPLGGLASGIEVRIRAFLEGGAS